MSWQPTALRRRLEQYVGDGILCIGAQASVSHAGVQHDIALGSAGPATRCTPGSVWRLYCAGKPVLAVAIALLVQDGLVDLDRPVSSHRSASPGPAGTLDRVAATPRQLLDHTAGLHRMHGLGVGALPAGARDEAVAQLRPPSGWDPARQAGYSEYAAWHVLGLLVESVTGAPLGTVLADEVCRPFAAGEVWFGMTAEHYERLYPRLAVASDLRGPHPVPLLSNRNRRPCTELNAAYGGYGTARGIQRFYRVLLATLAGRRPTRLDGRTLGTFVRGSRGRRHDESFGRVCDFGLGFMVGLADHGFEPVVSEAAFCHPGYYGTTIGFADPVADLAVGLVFNGIVDGEIGLRTRRNSVLRAVYADVGCLPGPDVLPRPVSAS